MPSFLVSFISLSGDIGSHVLELPIAPSTTQAAQDLQTSLGHEYGMSAVCIQNWDILPDGPSHPSGDGGPYAYFVSYQYVSEAGLHCGSEGQLHQYPLISLARIRRAEEDLRSRLSAVRVHLLSCKPMREATPQHLRRYLDSLRIANQS
jgi:hypothetical protein